MTRFKKRSRSQQPADPWEPLESRLTPRHGSGIIMWLAMPVVPVVDTWWQTETGGHMITPMPFATPLKPGSGFEAVFWY